MADRILPSPDIFATCPQSGKILDYYAGAFEAVFISLHPFIKASATLREMEKSPKRLRRADIAINSESVSWAEVARLADLPSLSAVDVGLRTMIRGLKTEFENREYAAKIEALEATEDIWPPAEGRFSDLLYQSILSSIKELGYEWLWIGDEFGTERKLHGIDDLRAMEDGLVAGHCSAFTPDQQLLWTTHWDSHFSFLCSSHEKLNCIQTASDLEGFFCTPDTEVYWSVRS